MVERGSGTPLPDATVVAGDASVTTASNGSATLTAARGAELKVTANGHDAASGTVPDDGDLRLELRPNVVQGTVTEAGGKPVAGVRVFVDGQSAWVRTAKDGTYSLDGVPEQATLIFKRAGYRLGEMELAGQATADFRLEPFE
ncbi:MAG TPA: carboxypeptidase-like regulatory domain-containing protein, partial [Candidatus Limnocylindria bacterium]